MPISAQSLIERMQWCAAQNLTAFCWSEDGTTVSLKREPSQGIAPLPHPVEVAPEAADTSSDVTALISGTCYLAPDINAAPFVQVGDRVHKGQTLCLIEAMKVMTALTAEWDGTVTAICVEDTVQVAAGDVVMQVQP